MAAYFQRVEALIASHAEKGNYLAPIRGVERLDRHKVESLTNGTVSAGFRVPERSVNTVWRSLCGRFSGRTAHRTSARHVGRWGEIDSGFVERTLENSLRTRAR